jgi:hypothetical protein
MRTIVFALIAILILGWFAPGLTNKANATNTILIQSTDKHVSSEMLARSAEIVTGRLKDYSSEKFEVTIIPERNQIKVILTDTWNLKKIETLLLQKGALAFYETFNHDRLAELLKGDEHLYSLFNNPGLNVPSGQVGCIAFTETEKVNDYIKTLALNHLCKFAWSPLSDQADVCLYALRSDSEKGAPMTGKDVESVKCAVDNSSGSSYIEIRFKEASAPLWSDLTKRNIGHTIAFVLDDMVISAPMVHEAISGGECQITGNFTSDEARTMAALANNGELPVGFEMVK